jgi:hypothetical protein
MNVLVSFGLGWCSRLNPVLGQLAVFYQDVPRPGERHSHHNDAVLPIICSLYRVFGRAGRDTLAMDAMGVSWCRDLGPLQHSGVVPPL